MWLQVKAVYHKPLVPRVYTVFEDRINEADQSVFSLFNIVTNLQLILQQSLEFLWWVMLYERSTWCTTFDGKTMAGMFSFCVVVCGSNEGDNEFLHSIE